MSSADKLQRLGITLVAPPKALGNYTPYQVVGKMVYISGQLPLNNGILINSGKVGETISLAEGQVAARQCAINILTQLQAACGGDLNQVDRCIRLGGFVNCTPDFTDQPKVINGASDLMVAVFGEAGRHARAAVGANSLPLGASVEIEATFLLK